MTNQKLLRLLEQDCTMPLDQLAAMADMPVDEVKREIKAMEEDKIILGYKAIVDWDRTERESVTALIEVKGSTAWPSAFISMKRWRASI